MSAPPPRPVTAAAVATGRRRPLTIVTGGLVVSATGRRHADVLIDGESIAALLAPGQAEQLGIVADAVIDATDKYVVPGGVDVHTHMSLPVGEFTSTDTFATGTTAAAWGGVTTIVDFVNHHAGADVRSTLEQRHAEAAGQCGVDDAALDAMGALVDREGITSFKLFMAYPGRLYSDDGQILRAMQRAGELGAMVMMHAENGIAIDVLIAQAVARGDVEPRHHALTRPPELEAEATHRAIQLARVAGNVPLYIVHLSASEALAQVAAARHAGRNVFAETCPQYLYLSIEEHLARPGAEGAKWICSTPLRSVHEPHRADLWTGLRTNSLAVVSTDHCPFCFKDHKLLGDPATGGTFASVPNGIGGVEHRMELMYQGVVAGELSLERWVETCCTTPARMFGLDRKGVLEPGADADVLVWDPHATTTLGCDAPGRKHHMNVDYSAYEGWEIAGRVDTVVSRGAVVVAGDEFRGRLGHGRFVARGVSRYVD